MGATNDKQVDGFPSEFVDPKQKRTAKYALDYARAFVREHQNNLTHPSFGWDGNNKHDLYKYRKYAQGEQDTDQYKTLFSHKRNIGSGKKNLSYTNIDHSVLPIAPRLINNLVGKILGIEMEANLRAIDPISVSERRKKKHRILSYLANKGFLEKLEKDSKIDLLELSPIPEGVPEPNDELNLDQYVDLFFKNKALMEFQDFIDLNMEANDKNQVLQEIAKDLVEIGIYGIKVYIDRYGRVKFRRVVVEETICNHCRFDDFRDLSRIGEYLYVTISELKTMWPGQPEKVYLEVANNASKKKYPHDVSYYHGIFENTNSFPYDDERIAILDFSWKSSDQVSKVIKPDKKGGKSVYEKDYKWWDGVDFKEYKERYPDREIIDRQDDNWYEAKWIVGTDYVFDNGLATNMMRENSNLSAVKGNFIIRRTECIMKNIIPMLDNIQLNFLKYQQHLIHSLPREITIEMTALENLSLGKGGEKMKPKDALALYFETGIMLWRRTHWRGSEAQFRPIDNMSKGIPQGAGEHLKMILDGIDLLRYLAGTPEVSDSTVPNPDIGKGVMQKAIESVFETIRVMVNTYRFGYENLTRKVLDATIDSVIHYGGDQYKEALGIDSVKFMEIVRDVSSRELGIVIEAGPDDNKLAFIQQMILQATKAGSIDAETSYMLSQEKNPYRAVLLLKQKTAENRQLQAQAEQAKVQGELDKNVQSSNIATDNKIKEEKATNDYKKDFEQFKTEINDMLGDKEFSRQLILEKMKQGHELSMQEQKIIGDIISKVAVADKKEASANTKATPT